MLNKITILLSAILFSVTVYAQVAIEWTDLVGANYNSSTNVLEKTASNGWNNAGARSVNLLDAYEDGKFNYTINDISTRKAIGLSTLNSDQKIRSIDYALVLNKNKLFIYEHAVFIGRFANFQVGDVFEVERVGTQILYKKNGNVFRQVTTNNEHILYVDAAIHSSGADITGVTTSFNLPINISRTKQDVVCGGGANGSIDITVSGGVSPYTYSWSNGATTEDISGLDIDKYTVTVTDAIGKQATKSINIQAPILWDDLTGVSENGNDLTKTTGNGWNAGAASYNQLAANEKGFVQYRVDQTNVIKAFGLSSNNNNNHYNTIDYGIFFLYNWVLVVENGSIAGFYGQYNLDDKFRIVRQANGIIKYKKNGEVFRQVSSDSNQTLIVDLAMFSANSTFNGIKSDFCNLDALTINYQYENSNCLGTQLGSIDISVLGGIEPYTYSWNNGATTEDITDLGIGEYTVTVTDNVGNTKQQKINIGTAVTWRNVNNGLACATDFIKPDVWIKLFGGAGDEYPGEIQNTSDGGYLISINTPDGSGNPDYHGGNDAWIIKLDIAGNIEWERMLGGSGNENLFYVEEDALGNFICGGGTYSSDGDIPINKGSMDYWAVKLDASGNTLWSKTFGGSGSDKAQDIEATSDGGYILGGESWSNDGDVTNGSGNNDYWLVKLDANGVIEWETTVGGASYEGATSIQEQSNGDYIVVGLTYSTNGDFANITQKGGGDLGFVRLNSNGVVQYVNLYGGSAQDGRQALTIEEADGIVIASRTLSSDQDVPNNNGSNDYWVFKIDTTGNILWSKTYGGSGNDQFMDIRKTLDGGYILNGYSNSTDGDIKNNKGGYDIWSIKLDVNGDLEWERSIGGKNDDEGTAVVETSLNEFLLLGVVGGGAGEAPNNQVCLKKIVEVDCGGENTLVLPKLNETSSIGVSSNVLLNGESGEIRYKVGGVGVTIALVASNRIESEISNYAIAVTNAGYKIYHEDIVVHIETVTPIIGDELVIRREGEDIIYSLNGNIMHQLNLPDEKGGLYAKTILAKPGIVQLQTDFCNQTLFSINTTDGVESYNYSISGAGINQTVTSGEEVQFIPVIDFGETEEIQITISSADGLSTSTITIEIDENLNVISSEMIVDDGVSSSRYGIGNYIKKGAKLNLNLSQLFAELLYFCPADNNINWTAAKFFDEDGNLISSGKSYYNYLGNPLQSQSKNFTDDIVIASQPVYDAYGRGVLTTLPAPTYKKVFCYDPNFIKANGGADYDYTQFDVPNYTTHPQVIVNGEVDRPVIVEKSTKGTLGWYYSNNNTEEPYVATTNYPYSRVEFDPNNPGSVKRSSAPHDKLRMGQEHEAKSFSMPASGELNYVFGYVTGWVIGEDAILDPSNNNNPTDLYIIANQDLKLGYNVVKNITVDNDGNENVTFIDADGKLVATCYSGTDDQGNNVNDLAVTNFIKGNDFNERYVDIHLPEGVETSLAIGNIYFNNNPQCYFSILDLDKNIFVYENVNGQSISLDPGYYRIINIQAPVVNGNVDNLPVRYDLNYYDFTLYYYDRAGRLVSTVSPNGVDQNFNPNLDVTLTSAKKQFQQNSPALPNPNTPYLLGGINDEVEVAIIPTPTNSTQFSLAVPYLTDNINPVVLVDANATTLSPVARGSGQSIGLSSELPRINVSNPGGNNIVYAQVPGCGCTTCLPSTLSQNDALQQANIQCAGWNADGSVFRNSPNDDWCVTCVAKPQSEIDRYYTVIVDIIAHDFVNSTNITLKQAVPIVARHHAPQNASAYWTFDYDANDYINDIYGFGTLLDVVNSENVDKIVAKVTDVIEMKQVSSVLPGDPIQNIPAQITYHYTQDYAYTYVDELDLNLTCITNEFPGGYPQHQTSNVSQYNSVSQKLKDIDVNSGNTDYVYSEGGLLRFSRNDKQKNENKFSYTNYDELGRPIESGQYTEAGGTIQFQNHYYEYTIGSNTPTTNVAILDDLDYSLCTAGGTCNDVTNIQYDYADDNFNTITGLPNSNYLQQMYLGNVSKTWNDNVTTWYSYDEQGRVLWMVQKIEDIGSTLAEKIKTIDYVYNSAGDLVEVIYQKYSATEYFAHRYTYDINKRLSNVETRDNVIGLWEQQAHYDYYQHGPLKRTELADELQGIDYIYTTTGWLKAINSPNLGETIGNQFIDPGEDGINNNFATDVFGMSIDYFSGDYVRSGKFVNYGITQHENYSGNIKSVRWNTAGLANPLNGNQWMYAYQYNNKQWLKEATFGEYSHDDCQDASVICSLPIGQNNHGLFAPNFAEDYKVNNITYDNNGNILTLNRKAYGTNNGMDNFSYNYLPNTNKLVHLVDNPANTTNWPNDLDNSTFAFNDQNSATWDYVYDELGQMIKNRKDNHYFEYNTAGLVTHIYNDEAKTDLLTTYHYDDKGFRYKKTIYTTNTPVAATFYVRDASGNVQSIYEKDLNTPANSSQQYGIFGSSRMGTYYKNGFYVYELTDHLGNVRATVNRIKNANNAVVESYADYYPFGEQLPGRLSSSSLLYKYTYQGQFAEEDAETGYNQFEARLWDGRLGRWLTTDPAGQFHSPYLGMGNTPAFSVDPDGEFAGPVWDFISGIPRGIKNFFTGRPWGCIQCPARTPELFRFANSGWINNAFIHTAANPVTNLANLYGNNFRLTNLRARNTGRNTVWFSGAFYTNSNGGTGRIFSTRNPNLAPGGFSPAGILPDLPIFGILGASAIGVTSGNPILALGFSSIFAAGGGTFFQRDIQTVTSSVASAGNYNITYDVRVRRQMTFASPAASAGMSRRQVRTNSLGTQIKRSRVRILWEQLTGRR